MRIKRDTLGNAKETNVRRVLPKPIRHYRVNMLGNIFIPTDSYEDFLEKIAPFENHSEVFLYHMMPGGTIHMTFRLRDKRIDIDVECPDGQRVAEEYLSLDCTMKTTTKVQEAVEETHYELTCS